MSIPNPVRAAYYLRVSTEQQELENQRGEIVPFIDRRGWKLVHTFEDVMSGRKSEKDRPGFAAMLKAAHQSKEVRHPSLLGFGPADWGRYTNHVELLTA